MNLSRTPRLKMVAADLALLLVAVIWGGGFIASKEALSSLSAFGVMSSRFLLSAAVMFLLFHKKILRGTGREIRYGVVIGAIQPDNTVKGGTGWGAEFAKICNKPLLVFDQPRDAWFAWEKDVWTEVKDPVITHAHFAATGTRFLEANGRQAIQELFTRSFSR